MNFSETAIATVSYNKEQVTTFFEDLPQLGIKTNVRKRSFVMRYKSPTNQKYRIVTLLSEPYAIPPDTDKVLLEYKKIEVAVLSGVDPLDKKAEKRDKKVKVKSVKKAKATTMTTLWDQYERSKAYKVLASSTQSNYYRGFVKHIQPAFGKVPVNEMNRPDCVAFLEPRTDTMVNHLLSIMRVLEQCAFDLGYIQNGFLDRIKRMPTRANEFYLEGEELTRFIHFLDTSDGWPSYIGALKLQLLTGCRIGEIVGMTWNEINFDEGVITIPSIRIKTERKSSPNPRPLWLPIVPEMRKVLLGQVDMNDRWVFPSIRLDNHVINCSLHSFLHKSGFNFGSHSLRRTVASIAMESEEIDELSLKLMLNHSIRGTTKVYARGKALQRKEKALRIWHGIIDSYRKNTN